MISLFVAGIIIIVVSFSGKTGIWVENLMGWERSGGGLATSRCDLSSGRWVFDNESYPLYSERQCTYLSDDLACEKFGRRDLKYQNWRWQPHQCNLPRFNATALLERLRGKRLVFVGDSLNRGQWVSMVCLLESSMPSAHKSMHKNGSLTTFKALEYNASVEFYWAPLLVESNSDDPVMHRAQDLVVRAESIIKHARHWTSADILVFNSYLWWRNEKMKIWWGSLEDNDGLYKEMELVRGYEMALSTWSNWLEAHVDPNRTRVFFMSVSATHQRGDGWSTRREQNCYSETKPITKERYQNIYAFDDNRMVKIITMVIDRLRERGIKVQMINITRLSEYRKDGHPSIYRKFWVHLTEDQLSNPKSYADCVHWCLPGVADAWNELLYAYIFYK
ncbi:hypothetical protein MRB53_003904 [Persea americana]|uniref:Uncharacterized protein n=1 Tax=Persea americana TaxID=3435 RepID=A0ACC2MYW6_PERAE|nr:hypothetical protein MRB53_003904 [Persea americana]